jgi:hypothetical protein
MNSPPKKILVPLYICAVLVLGLLHVLLGSGSIISSNLFGWLVADGWCWSLLREEYWLLVAGCSL